MNNPPPPSYTSSVKFKHADILRAYLDGKPIQTRAKGSLEWINVCPASEDQLFLIFRVDFEYRIRPEIYYRVGLKRKVVSGNEILLPFLIHKSSSSRGTDLLPELDPSTFVKWITPWMPYDDSVPEPIPDAF